MRDSSNPVVAEMWRGGDTESVHRGAWVLVSTAGQVIDGAGDPYQRIFARSSSKSLQALALFESGAAKRYEVPRPEIAVAIASHNGQPMHVDAARSLLKRAGHTDDDLLCGPEAPAGSAADAAGLPIMNNCSGKHAGFLAAAKSLGDAPSDYLDPDSALQTMVHRAVVDLTEAPEDSITTAIDGCSAPTFELPLAALARGIGRVANPGELAADRRNACEEIVTAAGLHPELVGGTSTRRFDTELLTASNGRLFAKGGAEAVQVIGVVGEGVALAAKIDDGRRRAMAPLVLQVLKRHDLITEDELDAMAEWLDPVRRNTADEAVGKTILPGF
ncbi:MAG: asparaginase [Acidimicrobiales bacterium]